MTRLVSVNLPDLSGSGLPDRVMWISVPADSSPAAVADETLEWWGARGGEPCETLFTTSAPPPPPRLRVRLVLGAHASETPGMVEVTLFAIPAGGSRVARRWTYEGTPRRARRVYEAYRRDARRMARAAGFVVFGTVEQGGVFGPRRADSY